MKVTVNGKNCTLKNNKLNHALIELGHENKTIAIAINERIIPHNQREEYRLQEGDDIIIVSPRQGG